MAVIITPTPPDSADVVALIAELDGYLTPLYPAVSRHGYSVQKLLAENVTFFVLHADGALAGCGGVKLFGSEYAEVKRMYTRPQFRGRGLAKLMLQHLAEYAHGQGVALLRLETGIHQAQAIGMYERLGFRRVPPFGAYQADPLSLFYEKQLG